MHVEEAERARIASALHRSIRLSGLSQAGFARAIGTSPARMSTYLSGKTIPSAAMYLRAMRWGQSLHVARQSGLTTPDDAVDAANRALADGNEDFALRLILQSRDDLRAATPEARSAWRYRAHTIGDTRFDTLLRAIIAHEFDDNPPPWAAEAQLDTAWIVEDPFRSDEAIRAQTPPWLARAHIYVAERGLATA